MYANPDVKVLSVDGIAPTIENIQNGSYPFVANFYAVTNGVPSGNARVLIDWILSPQGQWIIEETGYVPLMANLLNRKWTVPICFMDNSVKYGKNATNP